MKLRTKIIASILNLLSFQCFFFVGLGQAFYGNVKKGIFFITISYIVFLISGITGSLESFIGFLISMSLIVFIYFWAVLDPFFVKSIPPIKYKWYLRILFFMIFAIILHFANGYIPKKGVYDLFEITKKMDNFETGDYIMMKRGKDITKGGKALYILWSNDFHRIGKKIE